MKKVGVSKVRKRDGRIVRFDSAKVTNAISKAMISVGIKDKRLADRISKKVVSDLNRNFRSNVPSVEDIQDTVEKILMEESQTKTAKSYILYREKRKDIREAKSLLGVRDDVKLSYNAIKILEQRYLNKDENGHILETPGQMFRRVAMNIASAEGKYGKSEREIKALEKEFYGVMANLEFIPNSPTLMNAGTAIQQLSACFVLPIEDTMESIFDAVKNTSLIHQSGGGTGFSFSRLRPKGDLVKSTGGVASGPLSFMNVFNAATEVVKQGGRRRGANMAILRVDHPDIMDFIVSKGKEGAYNNFNLSVGITDGFMQALETDKEYDLLNPRDKEPVNRVRAHHVFDLIVSMAWRNGEPGIVFLDKMNKDNPTPKIGEIESTNPCGEQPLLPYESCNLGSLNLSKMVKGENGNCKIDWKKLKRTIKIAVHFLDNVIDMNKYPLKSIEKKTLSNRKIGLGIMGFADMLIRLGIPYNSGDAIRIADEVMGCIHKEGMNASEALSKQKGVFPNWKKSVFYKKRNLRNATITTIAPTGTISIIARCSSGIEPLFAISYLRKTPQFELLEVNSLFEEIARKAGIYSEELMLKIAKKGSIKDVKEIPQEIRNIFVTAHDCSPEDHIKIQATFQKHTDNAVSKTVNFPFDATTDDVESVYILAYKLGCKGVTIYRDRSREEQVLNIESGDRGKSIGGNASNEKNGGTDTDCPECGTAMNVAEGCLTCPACGYSKCSI